MELPLDVRILTTIQTSGSILLFKQVFLKTQPLQVAQLFVGEYSHAKRSDAVMIHQEIVEQFIQSFKSPPKELILDFDATDDLIHGEQMGRFFQGYYGNYCFLPLYVFCES